MRNNQSEAKMEDVDKALSIFASRFAELSAVCRAHLNLFKSISKASAFEVQHICMHLAAVAHCPEQNNIQLRHANSAFGHLNRALLDAYKSLIFKYGQTETPSVDFLKDFAKCRSQEFDDGCQIEYSPSLNRYRAFCKKHSLVDIKGYQHDETILPAIAASNKESARIFFEKIAVWLRQDLLLSAITPGHCKNLGMLRAFVQLIFNGQGPKGENKIDYLNTLTFMQRCLIIRCTLELEEGIPIHTFANNQLKTKQLVAAQNALHNIKSKKKTHQDERALETFYLITDKFWNKDS